MLIVWRIVFGVALGYMVLEVRRNAQTHPDTGDLLNAGYLTICLGLGIANAIVWAPFFGARVSEPITSTLTDGAFIDSKNRLVQAIYWLQDHGWRRLALVACVLEGMRHPDMPAAFIVGLRNARTGSWLEKIFAKEVFRFNNIQNCVYAYRALKRHGIAPGAHPNPEVNLMVLSLERRPKAEPEPVPVPPAAPQPPLARDPRIQLFDVRGSAEGGERVLASE
jgi:hypothetical protein